MASGGRKKTTFAKLAREQKLRERKRDKQARKDARKRASELDLATLPDSGESELDLAPLPDTAPPAREP